MYRFIELLSRAGFARIVIDAEGVHVRGDISYGGSLTDYGKAGFAEAVKEREREEDAR